ncbi:MAG: alkaline phosphatase family protein, partial [Phycisphaerales bacterium]|nr:alkaline phosphatase family protein [Phycisphaerales bacterium]
TTGRRVLLIGWDAADWKFMRPMMDAGEMPNLSRFVGEGVTGNVATLHPALSPMLWNSIATGKLADKHGVLGFAEPDGTTGKARPVTSTSRKCKALWNILSDRGRPAGAVNWYASHPAERVEGFVVTDRFAHPTGPIDPGKPDLGWPTVPGSVWPEEDLETLATVRVHPAMIGRDMVGEFVPEATDQASARWPKIAELRTLLAHCTTVHNAATAYLTDRPWDFFGIYYDAIDRMAHSFMEFHPPKMEHVGGEDFARYSGVMHACYRLHDLMLGRIMNLIDERTVVCLLSDHGFHSDHLRPSGTSAIKDGQPVAWHRQYGVVGFWGPGMKRGETLYGASLLDIAPTVLAILGMPIPDDMDGRPLLQIFETQPEKLERIETYETEGEARDAANPDDADVSAAMLEHLRQLGYVGSDDAEDVELDRMKNLGVVYLSTGRPERAAEQFQAVLAKKPDDRGSKMSLVSSCIAIGRFDRCDRLCDELAEDGVERPRVDLLRAVADSARGDDEAAPKRLREVERQNPDHPGLRGHLGQMFLKRGMLAEAERHYNRAFEADPDDAGALDGLGQVYARTGRPAEAVLSHMRSIALEHHRPMSHLHLARALREVGRTGWALEAIAVVLRMSPGMTDAHELAAEIYEEQIGNPRKAAFHRTRIEQINTMKARSEAAKQGHDAAGTPHTGPRRARAERVEAGPIDPGGPVTIVSGLPRSGTSLMMQMLEAGGLPALTDREREADEDNPRGYYELEAVKDTARDPRWLNGAGGRVVKMVHVLLRSLPRGPEYRVVFMRREIDQIIASQRRMLDRQGHAGGGLDNATLREAYERDLSRTFRWLEGRPRFRVHQVSYNGLMAKPGPVIDGLVAFLGGGPGANL